MHIWISEISSNMQDDSAQLQLVPSTMDPRRARRLANEQNISNVPALLNAKPWSASFIKIICVADMWKFPKSCDSEYKITDCYWSLESVTVRRHLFLRQFSTWKCGFKVPALRIQMFWCNTNASVAVILPVFDRQISFKACHAACWPVWANKHAY